MRPMRVFVERCLAVVALVLPAAVLTTSCGTDGDESCETDGECCSGDCRQNGICN